MRMYMRQAVFSAEPIKPRCYAVRVYRLAIFARKYVAFLIPTPTSFTELIPSLLSSPTTTYNFEYDTFGNNTKVKIGSSELTENTYAANNGNLLRSDYGNGDRVEYSSSTKGERGPCLL